MSSQITGFVVSISDCFNYRDINDGERFIAAILRIVERRFTFEQFEWESWQKRLKLLLMHTIRDR